MASASGLLGGASESPLALPPDAAPGTIVVIGGGCYGSYHARQLARARDRGAIPPQEILIVDRDPSCAARTEFASQPGFQFLTATWDDFLDAYLDTRAPDTLDRIVPTPIASHLMFHWLRRRAERLCGAPAVQPIRLPALPDTPYATSGPDGAGYLSFATWICPITCYEPATCPETRGPKSWEMDDAVFAYARRMRAAGHPFDLVEVFRIRHYAWGIATFPTALAVGAGGRLDRAVTVRGGLKRILVGTVSSCHGIINAVELNVPEPGP